MRPDEHKKKKNAAYKKKHNIHTDKRSGSTTKDTSQHFDDGLQTGGRPACQVINAIYLSRSLRGKMGPKMVIAYKITQLAEREKGMTNYHNGPQTADNTPTFFSDGKWFSDHCDTQMTEKDIILMCSIS